MRNTETQLLEIRDRAEKLKKDRKKRSTQALGGAVACVCLILIAVLSRGMTNVVGKNTALISQYGGLILSEPKLGFVMIGILAFLLGVCVTLICVRLRDGESQWKK